MANNQQIQTWVNERVRPRCEATRGLVASYDDDRAAIDDIYQALNNSPTWTDQRGDGVPHLATPSDVLAQNAFEEDVRVFMKGHASWPVILRLCVRQIGG